VSATPVGDALDAAYKLLEAHARSEVARCVGSAVNPAAALAIEDGIIKQWPRIVRAVESLVPAKVLGGGLVLVDDQPIQRVTVKIGRRKKVHVLDPRNMLEDVYWNENREEKRFRGPGSPAGELLHRTLAALEPALNGVLAPVRADATNAVAKAMADETITGPIRTRLAKKRALARERAMNELRETFKGKAGILSKDDVVQAWDEAVCAQVMES